MPYIIFLVRQQNHIDRNSSPASTFEAGHSSLGFFAPVFFGSTFSAFSAANG